MKGKKKGRAAREKPAGKTAGKLAALHERLRSLGSVLVAYSGGVDSTFLLNEAVRTLGPRNVVAATALSETYTGRERERAVGISRSLKIRHELIETRELDDPAFRRNDPDRCYHCKRELFGRLSGLRRRLGLGAVVDASQAGDRNDYRPGWKAKTEWGVLSPLLDAGFTKKEIRTISRARGLPTADLPSAACLASRIPYGTPVTGDLVARLARGEEAIRRLGFKQFRLRHHGPVARLEFAPAELDRAFRFRRSLHRRIASEGWTYVALDLEGYRTGSLNETLDGKTFPGGEK